MKPAGFDILYEEGPCLAVDKPGGLLTQAPPHIDSLEKRLRQYLQQRDAKPGRIYLGVPHRLDRPVSGVLLFARHVRAARRLSGQFERRMVDKRYVALLEGALDNDAGEWVDYIGKVPDQPRRSAGGRPPAGAVGPPALPRALPRGGVHVRGHRTRHREVSSDSHPGGLTSASSSGRRTIWCSADFWPGLPRRARPVHRTTCPEHLLLSSDDTRIPDGGRAAAGLLGRPRTTLTRLAADGLTRT